MKLFLIMISLFINVSGFDNLNCGKVRNTFSHVTHIDSYNEWNENRIKILYEKEHYNFHQEPIRLLFHEEPAIITVHDDKTRVTGFFGEIWTFLSEYANFTLVLRNVYEKRIGIRRSYTSSYNGLMRYIEQEEADIIARIEIFDYWLDVVDYLLPLWNDGYRVFAQLSYHENSLWMIRLSTLEVWFLGSVMYLLFFLSSIVKELLTKGNKKRKIDYSGTILYYHGVFGQRSFFLFELQQSSRILNTCTCFYSMMILSFFNAKILYLMMNKTPVKPFDGIESLYSKTNYTVIAEKDSVVHLAHEYILSYEKESIDNPIRNLTSSGRIKFLPTRSRMYYQACTSKDDYAIIESEYLKVPITKYGCKFEPTDKIYYHNWVGSAVKKNFTYKRTIDRGILKLIESGLLNCLKNRLVGLKEIDHSQKVQPVNMEQISGILGTLLFAAALSILMLFEEITTYRLGKYGSRGKVVEKK